MKIPKMCYGREHDWLAERCKGKSVLHLGCAGDANLKFGRDACLHYWVSQVATRLVGLEIEESSLISVKKMVPPVPDRIEYFLGDAEKLDLLGQNEKFDVVLAGSIIEHLSNPGKMLNGLRPMLMPGGLLLISTPNTFGLLQFIRVALKRVEAVNEQHTCWYSVATLLQLVERYGFQSVEWGTCHGWYPDSFQWRIKQVLGEFLFSLVPHLGGGLLASFEIQDNHISASGGNG